MAMNRRRSPGQRPLKRAFARFTLRARSAARTLRTSGNEPRRPAAPSASRTYLLLLFLTVAVVVAAFVSHLYIRFEGVRLGYETSIARADRARLLVERRELRLELASLKDPERVEAEAREKLGMAIPDHGRIIPIGKQSAPTLASGGTQ